MRSISAKIQTFSDLQKMANFIVNIVAIAYLYALAAGTAMANFWIALFHSRRIRMMISIILSLLIVLLLEFVAEAEANRRACLLCAL